MTWREDMRADRTAVAADRRADRAAQAEQRRADLAAVADQRRKDADAAAKRRRAEQDAKRARASARRAALAAWFRSHVLELLFVPVIVVPGLLAWPAMAAYGRGIFGPPGVLLPGFTEGAMWAFAFAVGLAQRQQRSTWALQLGVWVCAAMAGGMNFLHGATGPAGNVAHGVVMAVVSVGGVIVHQLITARPLGPRRSRDERKAAQVARQAERRITAVRRAAVRQAVADLASDGTARLVYRPGLVTLTRSWSGRSRLVDAIVSGLPAAPLPEVDPMIEELNAEITSYLSGLPAGNGGNTPGTAQTPATRASETAREPVPPAIAKRVPGLLARVEKAIAAGKLPTRPTRTEIQKYLRCRAEVAVAVTNALHDHGDGQEATA